MGPRWGMGHHGAYGTHGARGGQSSAPSYVLHVKLTEVRKNLAVRKDTVATRANLIMRARFQLVRFSDEVVLMKNSAISANSYNILNEEFATLSAVNDARFRAVRELSDTIRTLIAVYLDNIS